MILVASQRGGGRDLACHLMKADNDHVELHDLRGFASDDLNGAFKEAYATSKATRCKQFLFSLSLDPPQDADVSTDQFDRAIDQIEKDLGLEGQPRAVVFHEKEGRRHAHTVWSRIKADEMKAVQMSHYKTKLQDRARELYLEHGWKMPEGLARKGHGDPRNFTLEEWQQAKRAEKDPREVKEMFQDAWAISDSKVAFRHSLEERGYRLCRGDRRGYVALDWRGEPYSLSRWVGQKPKVLKERLGEPEKLPSVDDTKAIINRDMLANIERLENELDAKKKAEQDRFNAEKAKLIADQRTARQKLLTDQKARADREAAERQARFRTGISGLWDRLRGEHKRIQMQNEREAEAAKARDKQARHALVLSQLSERRNLKQKLLDQAREIERRKSELQQDKQRFSSPPEQSPFQVMAKARPVSKQPAKQNTSPQKTKKPAPLRESFKPAARATAKPEIRAPKPATKEPHAQTQTETPKPDVESQSREDRRAAFKQQRISQVNTLGRDR